MKHVLAITLLLSVAQASAMSYEEAQQRLGDAQAKVAAVHAKMEAARSDAETAQATAQSASGYEYRRDMVKHREKGRQALVRHNKIIETELKEANAHLQKALDEVGRFHEIISDGKVYKVVKREQKKLEPIRSARPVRS